MKAAARVALVGAVVLASATAWLAPAHAAPGDGPLAGKTIVVDPGHQLGNSNPRFAKYMNQTIFNGAITKACNTTGTATNAGLPEATFTWRVARHLRRLLEDAGATVIMTRSTNSRDAWGPCVWDRARIANRPRRMRWSASTRTGPPPAARGSSR